MENNKKYINDIWFESLAVDEDKAWFAAGNSNMLVEMDLKTFNINAIGNIPDELKRGVRLYSGIEKYNNLLILVPMFAKEIAIYDLDSNRFKKIPIKLKSKNCKRYNENFKFFAHHLFNKYCFIIGHTFPGIVCLNLEDMSLCIIDEWVNELEEKANNDKKGYFMDDYCINGNELIIPSCISNMVLILNMFTLETTLIELRENNTNYSGICSDGMNYWFMSVGMPNKVVCWNRLLNKCETIELNNIFNVWYIRAIYKNGVAYFFPSSSGGEIVAFDTETYRVKDEKWITEVKNKGFFVVKLINDKIYALSNSNEHKMHIFDILNKTVDFFPMTNNTENYNIDFRYYHLLDGLSFLVVEEKESDLKRFLNSIEHNMEQMEQNLNMVSNGEKIYSTIKKQCMGR